MMFLSCLRLLCLCGEQVEVLSAVVNSIATTVRADAVIDVGAGQVCIHPLLFFFNSPQSFPFIVSTWMMLNLNCRFNG